MLAASVVFSPSVLLVLTVPSIAPSVVVPSAATPSAVLLSVFTVVTFVVVVLASVLVFPLIHIARYLSLWLPTLIMPRKNRFTQGQLVLLTWCGLRGGVSVALALALGSQVIADGAMDASSVREFEADIHPAFILSAFTLVTMSMVIQGLTAPLVVRKSRHMDDKEPG